MTPSAADRRGAAALVAVVVVMLLVIGVGVKLYDAKRKREGDALMVLARISDALLRDFATLPITAVANREDQGGATTPQRFGAARRRRSCVRP